MRAILQRVLHASVSVTGSTISSIDKGLLVLVGITRGDTIQDAEYLYEIRSIYLDTLYIKTHMIYVYINAYTYILI